ncbi:ATP-binding protein [Kitasatospora sp. NBC_00374]|uniref:ATP-binding protein n=1 Tax=Kitasatospora sp. NBC_00374 TaxID=2975964 RepID=UPI0030E03EE3
MSDRTFLGTGGVERRQGRLCRLDLSAAAHPVTTAREWARSVLSRWQIGSPLDEDVVLVVSELVANAMMHAGAVRELHLLWLDRRTVRIEVTDTSRTAPSPMQPRRGRPGGHGLVIVRTLCRSWGTVPRAAGKTVWAELVGSWQPGA